MRSTITRLAALALLPLAAGLSGCGGAAEAGGSSGGSDRLSLVAYSTPKEAYEALIPAFQKTPEGKGVSFTQSYGSSGDQSRAVSSGLPADVVALSLAPDVDKLVEPGIVAQDWASDEHDGFVTNSVVVLAVRKGNPKGIKTWDDLLEPGVEVVTPNPFTSGAAKWNLLGAYAHGGLDYVERLITEHVEVQPKSGREALQTFTGGEGDVLLSYEYEARTAQKKGGEDVELIIPADTLRVDITLAKTAKAPAAAQAFVDHVLSAPGQQRFADWGYRPVNEGVLKANADRFPEPKDLFTIDDLGGWDKVNADYFDIENGAITKIEEEAGVSTAP